MKRSTKRLLLLMAILPVAVLVVGTSYMELMNHLEGAPRNLWTSIEWSGGLVPDRTARRLHESGQEVVRARHALAELRFDKINHANAIVANSSDQGNADLLLTARDHGFEGAFYALVEDPMHHQPLTTLGATAVYTPVHVLAKALASRASRRIHPSIQGIQQLGEHLGVVELRIHENSPFVGEILSQTHLRERHGVVVPGLWHSGRFVPRPLADTPLQPGDIIAAVGRQAALEGLSRLAVPLTHQGPIVIAGYGEVGRKVRQLLMDAGKKPLLSIGLRVKGWMWWETPSTGKRWKGPGWTVR